MDNHATNELPGASAGGSAASAAAAAAPPCPQKEFRQCFWHADGTLSCQQTKVPACTPETNVQFDTFGAGNERYAPNAYREGAQGKTFEEQRQPCCNVPCKGSCRSTPKTFTSPPRGIARFA